METSQQLAKVGIMFPDDAEDFISRQQLLSKATGSYCDLFFFFLSRF